MDLSTSMRYVMVRADAEAALSRTTLSVEHVFLGLLKLSEVKAEEIAPKSRHKVAIDEDIKAVRALFEERGLDTSALRHLLRRILVRDRNAMDGGQQALAVLLAKAAENAEEAGQDFIWGAVTLKAIVAAPTPVLRELLQSGAEEHKAVTNTSGRAEKSDEASESADIEPDVSFLSKLTDSIRKMRYTLLSGVHGQDHAVHAFAEGMFSAGVLAAADTKRRRPRAIFVFAGPPGVGKTFLAEQAADALNIPFKRFDMSGYSDHHQHVNLVGYAPSYKEAKAGTLTSFVKDNPECILLFDEVEKAHLNTIHLFLQILDAGVLHDDFEDEDVAFKDAVIIFTTNAGRQLYEGEGQRNAAGLPRQTILNALETDKHPQSGAPFFPAAICSRLATGWPLMFNHLQAHELEKISAAEFKKFCGLFEKQYGITVSADALLPTTLLYAEGGLVDARTLRARTELFFKNEIFKVSALFTNDSLTRIFSELKQIDFTVETDKLPDDVTPLFHDADKPEILIFGNNALGETCAAQMPRYVVHYTTRPETAYTIAGERDLRMALLDIAGGGKSEENALAATQAGMERSDAQAGTISAFDNVPMAADVLKHGREFFLTIRERLPELPVYVLESSHMPIDGELLLAFVKAGARDKIVLPENGFDVFAEQTTTIMNQLYMQKVAAALAAERKALSYETAPKLSADKKSMTIRLRQLSLKRSLSAEDSGEVLTDVEKPKTLFTDVIGAASAKDELLFFINFLKNPKKFVAQGLKPPKGVLLYGPPGTGKTLLAKAMAGESDVAFIPAVASAFVTKYQGSGPEAVRKLFQRAKRYAPSIVFIDEIDAIGRARGRSNAGHGEEMALNALLTEMDGFSVDPKRPVFVLAATNFDIEEGKGGMGTIDAALARRFDRKVLVDLPDQADRRKYLEMMLNKRPGHEVTQKMIEQQAGRSTGMSLANMEAVLELGWRTASKKGVPLNDDILAESFELVRHGEKKDWGRDYLERVARHEAGHAYLCHAAGKTPAYLTIVARGDHGGYMEYSAEERSPLQTRDQLLGRMRIALGGRAAEIIYYGEQNGLSSGASGDLQQATSIARAMICSYGMDNVFGLAVLSQEEATKGPLAEKIIQRIAAIIKEEMAATIEALTKARPRLDALVERLLEKNKLDSAEIKELLSE